MTSHCQSSCKREWAIKVVEHLVNDDAKLDHITALLEQVEREGMDTSREREKMIHTTPLPFAHLRVVDSFV